MAENNIQKQLIRLRRNKKFLWFGILFLVLVIIWILTSIFATTKTSTISQELRDLAKPFVPRLESKVLDEILVKRVFSDEELSNFSIFVLDTKNIDGGEVAIDITSSSEGEKEVIEEELSQLTKENEATSTESSVVKETEEEDQADL